MFPNISAASSYLCSRYAPPVGKGLAHLRCWGLIPTKLPALNWLCSLSVTGSQHHCWSLISILDADSLILHGWRMCGWPRAAPFLRQTGCRPLLPARWWQRRCKKRTAILRGCSGNVEQTEDKQKVQVFPVSVSQILKLNGNHSFQTHSSHGNSFRIKCL